MDVQQEAEDTGNGQDNEEKLGDENGSDESDDEEEDPIIVKDADDFIHHILRRLRSGYRISEPHNSYIGMVTSKVKWMAPKELDALICLLVKSRLIPLIPDNVYDEQMHDHILMYLEECLSVGLVRCGNPENSFRHTTGIEYEYVDWMFVSRIGINWEWDIFPLMDYYELDESIKNFPRLETLKIDTHCASLPSGLSELKCLKKITIMDNYDCDEERTWPSHQEGFPPPSELGALEEVHFNLDQLREQQVSSGIRFWLKNASFPVLKEICLVIGKDGATQTIPGILEAFQGNKSLHKFPRLRIELGYSCQNVGAVADLFLNLVPEMCPNLAEFVMDQRRENGPGEDFFSEVEQRLRSGQYSEALLRSFRFNLRSLRCPCPFKYFPPKSLKSTIAMLKFFPRLSYISNAEHLWDRKLGERTPQMRTFGSPNESPTIDYLLRINHGGARLFIPDTALRLSSQDDDGEAEISPTLPSNRKPLPISVWPHIIAREDTVFSDYELPLYRRFNMMGDCTALYRMLRPNSDCLGPALQSILEQEVGTVVKRSLNDNSQCESSRAVKAKKED